MTPFAKLGMMKYAAEVKPMANMDDVPGTAEKPKLMHSTEGSSFKEMKELADASDELKNREAMQGTNSNPAGNAPGAYALNS